jgi:hypothetical protein
VIIKEGWTMSQVHEKMLVEGINGRDHLGAKGMGRRIILKCI